MYIIEKVKWCNEKYEKNCEGCPHNKGFKTPEVRAIDSVRAEQHKLDLRTRRKKDQNRMIQMPTDVIDFSKLSNIQKLKIGLALKKY